MAGMTTRSSTGIRCEARICEMGDNNSRRQSEARRARVRVQVGLLKPCPRLSLRFSYV